MLKWQIVPICQKLAFIAEALYDLEYAVPHNEIKMIAKFREELLMLNARLLKSVLDGTQGNVDPTSQKPN